MEIASIARDCLAKFKTLLDQANIHSRELEDEYGRFRIWAGNISAHRTGRRSLEYRLRDSSNLQATVTSLLKDLQALLGQLQRLPAQEQLDDEAHAGVLHALEATAGSQFEDDEDAALFGLDEEDSSPNAFFAQILDEAHDIITCLLRFSMTLRNPARHDQLKQAAATTTKHFEPHDINHVHEKFPHAPVYLHNRLGKAISKHRQYFKYREDHHVKLAEGLDDAQDGAGERPSTIATSLNQSEKALPLVSKAAADDETESVYTATSFAPTSAGNTALKPPPLPEAGRSGDPFECPLCFGIVVAEDQRSWRQHIYEDLPPYVCTFEACVSGDHKYSRRRDWQRHQAKYHNRHWVCPFGCAGNIATEADFLKHLAKAHTQSIDTASTQRMADACAVADELSELTCPLCQDTMPNAKRWYKHLGHHLEQFALHALPQHVLGADSDNEDAEIVDNSDIEDEHIVTHEMIDPVDEQLASEIEVEPEATTEHVRMRASSYWSVPEQKDFVKYIGYFGRDFAAMAAHMGTKTQTMLRNHYMRQIDNGSRPELEQSALLAEERRSRGEDLGPPPHPTPIVKRKYDNPQPPTQRPLAPSEEHDSILEQQQPGPVISVQTEAEYDVDAMGNDAEEIEIVDDSNADIDKLILNSVMHGVDKVPDSWFAKAPGISGDGVVALESEITRRPSPDSESEQQEPSRPLSDEANVEYEIDGARNIKDAVDGVKKGRTRVPKRVVSSEALKAFGYLYDEEDGCFVLRVALEKEQIDELIKASRDNYGHRCHACGAGFETNADLKHHMRSHTPEQLRPHLCQVCGKRFLYPKDLDRHARIHSPPSLVCPYEDCKYSIQGFKRQDHLNRHLQTAHSDGSTMQVPMRRDTDPAERAQDYVPMLDEENPDEEEEEDELAVELVEPGASNEGGTFIRPTLSDGPSLQDLADTVGSVKRRRRLVTGTDLETLDAPLESPNTLKPDTIEAITQAVTQQVIETLRACERCRDRETRCDDDTPCGPCRDSDSECIRSQIREGDVSKLDTENEATAPSEQKPNSFLRDRTSRVHRRVVAEESLLHFDIPYKTDESDPEWYIFNQWLSSATLEQLKEHTARLRNTPRASTDVDDESTSNTGTTFRSWQQIPLVSDSADSPIARQWFIPGDGIDRHVISTDVQRYLGKDAVVRPGQGTGSDSGVSGYWIKAYRNLTAAMIADLRADSTRWRQEQRSTGTRGPYEGWSTHTQSSGGKVQRRDANSSESKAEDSWNDDEIKKHVKRVHGLSHVMEEKNTNTLEGLSSDPESEQTSATMAGSSTDTHLVSSPTSKTGDQQDSQFPMADTPHAVTDDDYSAGRGQPGSEIRDQREPRTDVASRKDALAYDDYPVGRGAEPGYLPALPRQRTARSAGSSLQGEVPIRVDPSDERDKLYSMSRIDFTMPRTVEHYTRSIPGVIQSDQKLEVGSESRSQSNVHTAENASSKNVQFAEAPSTAVSRPLTDTEARSASRFESHARKCYSCYDPEKLYRDRGHLCLTGTDLARDVATHLSFSSGDQIYAQQKTDGKRVPVELDPEYASLRALLKHKKHSRLFLQPVLERVASTLGSTGERARPRYSTSKGNNQGETVIVEPADSRKRDNAPSGSGSRGYRTWRPEVVQDADMKRAEPRDQRRGSLYAEDAKRQPRDKGYRVEVREPEEGRRRRERDRGTYYA